MVDKQGIIEKAKEAIMEFDDKAAKAVAGEVLNAGIDPVEIVEKGFTVAMNDIGEKFAKGILFLPHVIAASHAMEAAMDILTPGIVRNNVETKFRATIVIGTIEGDIHSIGKDIVATMLRMAGYNVLDLGRDVPIKTYVQMAVKVKADVVASSALMTITMVNQGRIENELREAGLRENLKTMVGGAPVTQEWADIIGADIYAKNAPDAVKKLNELFA